jgi:hypothetical protein
MIPTAHFNELSVAPARAMKGLTLDKMYNDDTPIFQESNNSLISIPNGDSDGFPKLAKATRKEDVLANHDQERRAASAR